MKEHDDEACQERGRINMQVFKTERSRVVLLAIYLKL